MGDGLHLKFRNVCYQRLHGTRTFFMHIAYLRHARCTSVIGVLTNMMCEGTNWSIWNVLQVLGAPYRLFGYRAYEVLMAKPGFLT